MSGPGRSLRRKLLRWLLIPLTVLFVVDATGSWLVASRLSRGVHDGEQIGRASCRERV